MVRKPGYKPTKTLWIFCEGKTEELYFNKLRFEERIRRLKIKPIVSGHQNADGVIQEAIDFINKERDFQEDDLVVCVFDRNANTNNQLNKAKSLAKKHNIIISFSNPCFEYWILCHDSYFPSPCEKPEIISKLKNYKKNDSELYTKTKNKILNGISNANKVKQKHIKEGTSLICRQSNPLSLIFEIINMIEEFRN